MHAPAPKIDSTPGRFTPRTLVYFGIITLIWGSTWLVIKTQLGVVPASWSVAWRFLLAAAVMFGVCLATGKSLRLGGRGHGFALMMALMQFSLNFNLVYRAEEHVTSGLVALAFATLVVPNAILAAIFLGQRITPGFALGSLLGIVGVGMMFARDILLAGGGDTGVGDNAVMLGLGLTLAGVMCASIGNVMQASPAGRALPLEGGLAWSMAYGGVMNVIVAWVLAGPPAIDLSFGYLAGLAYLGIVASAVAFSLYYAIIRAVGPGKAAYSGIIIPVVAIGLSTVFEGYQWTWLAVAGALLALAGFVIALRSRD